MGSEERKGTIHCAGCGRWIGVPNEEAAEAIEGIVWCEECIENGTVDKKNPKPRRQLRCPHDNGWLSVECHGVFVNHLGELMISGRNRSGRLLMRCNMGCGKTKYVPIPKVGLTGNRWRTE